MILQRAGRVLVVQPRPIGTMMSEAVTAIDAAWDRDNARIQSAERDSPLLGPLFVAVAISLS